MIKNNKTNSGGIYWDGVLIPISERINLKFDLEEFNELISTKDIIKLKDKLIKKAKLRNVKKRSKIRPLRNPDEVVKVATEYRDNLIKNQTEAEKKFKIFLKKYDTDYIFQHIYYFESDVNVKKFYILDFFLPKRNICFEIDGGYHMQEHVKNRDKHRTRILSRSGIRVIRITNEEVKSTSLLEQKLEFLLGEKPLIMQHERAVKRKKKEVFK